MSGPLWTSAEIARATGGEALSAFSVNAVTFDSREVRPGALFIALKGAAADGHRFAGAAIEAGAAGLLVSGLAAGPQVRVPDTMAALEALGAAGRDRAARATVIGVTGSVGKTTVKELIRGALAPTGPTHASVKSYNNHTGVPLSLARMPADTRWAVFEMGMNHAGEIAKLTAQVRPHVALITAIGPAHIEQLGSEEAIADAKGEIFAGLLPDGVAVIPYDTRHRARLAAAAAPHAARAVSFGLGEGAEVRAIDVIEDAGGSSFRVVLGRRRLVVRVPAPGLHRVQNALAALAAVEAAGGEVEAAAEAIGTAEALPGRGARKLVALPGGGDALLIDESYNANPASMAAALQALGRTLCTGRKLAVIGAMRELGAFSADFHRALAPLLDEADVAAAVLVGEETAPLAAAWPRAVPAPDWTAALAVIRSELRPGDALLVKGSNSVGLGRLVAALEGAD